MNWSRSELREFASNTAFYLFLLIGGFLSAAYSDSELLSYLPFFVAYCGDGSDNICNIR